MIHVSLQPEPSSFDARVRQPGNTFLASCPRPNSNQWSRHNYWNRVSNELYQSYGGICAYSGQWFSKTTSQVSVDHFYPKSTHQEKAYEWDNYRLTTQIMNGYKGDKIVMDPFEIQDGDLTLDFPSCLVKPRNDMTPAEKSKAKSTIQILHLNDEEQALVKKVSEELRKITKVGCTGCRYCMPCPKGVDIPGTFNIYNTYSN